MSIRWLTEQEMNPLFYRAKREGEWTICIHTSISSEVEPDIAFCEFDPNTCSRIAYGQSDAGPFSLELFSSEGGGKCDVFVLVPELSIELLTYRARILVRELSPSIALDITGVEIPIDANQVAIGLKQLELQELRNVETLAFRGLGLK